MTKIDYSAPDYVLKSIKFIEEEIDKSRSGDIDGFDDAFNIGMEVILKELKSWDGGISENYLKGIQYALDIYQIEEIDNL